MICFNPPDNAFLSSAIVFTAQSKVIALTYLSAKEGGRGAETEGVGRGRVKGVLSVRQTERGGVTEETIQHQAPDRAVTRVHSTHFEITGMTPPLKASVKPRVCCSGLGLFTTRPPVPQLLLA